MRAVVVHLSAFAVVTFSKLWAYYKVRTIYAESGLVCVHEHDLSDDLYQLHMQVFAVGLASVSLIQIIAACLPN